MHRPVPGREGRDVPPAPQRVRRPLFRPPQGRAGVWGVGKVPEMTVISPEHPTTPTRRAERSTLEGPRRSTLEGRQMVTPTKHVTSGTKMFVLCFFYTPLFYLSFAFFLCGVFLDGPPASKIIKVQIRVNS